MNGQRFALAGGKGTRTNLGAVDVQWDSDVRIAHLKGTVDSNAEREGAEAIAESAIETVGRVLNEPTVEGLNDETADDLDDGSSPRSTSSPCGRAGIARRSSNRPASGGGVSY